MKSFITMMMTFETLSGKLVPVSPVLQVPWNALGQVSSYKHHHHHHHHHHHYHHYHHHHSHQHHHHHHCSLDSAEEQRELEEHIKSLGLGDQVKSLFNQMTNLMMTMTMMATGDNIWHNEN